MALLAKHGIPPVEGLTPKALKVLEKAGVDAVLSLKAMSAGIGGPNMRKVRARLTNTRNGKELGGIDWNNAWGGMPGSPADYAMRKNVTDAVREIAGALAKLLE